MRLLPFEYAVRNLGRSPLRLAMSVLGAALVVALIIAAGGFVRGMASSLKQSGSPNNVILLGAGSEESIERSEVSPAVAGIAAASIRGIKSRMGVPFVSPEVHMAVTVTDSPDRETDKQTVVRGVLPAAFLVHPQVQMVEGRAPNPGANEIAVGALAATRMGLDDEKLGVGRSVYFDELAWTVVGRFEAPGTVMNAEVWAHLSDVQVASKRDSLSCVVVTMGAPDTTPAQVFAATRTDLELTAMSESAYYRKLVSFYTPVRIMIWVTAGLIALGGVFGGLNTMYAAFASRAREIGMLRSLGFSRRAVIWSITQESTLAASAGALLGATAALLLLDGVTVRISMGAFGLRVDGPVMAIGLASGVALGIAGALPPTLRCLRMPIAEALKAA